MNKKNHDGILILKLDFSIFHVTAMQKRVAVC